MRGEIKVSNLWLIFFCRFLYSRVAKTIAICDVDAWKQEWKERALGHSGRKMSSAPSWAQIQNPTCVFSQAITSEES